MPAIRNAELRSRTHRGLPLGVSLNGRGNSVDSADIRDILGTWVAIIAARIGVPMSDPATFKMLMPGVLYCAAGAALAGSPSLPPPLPGAPPPACRYEVTVIEGGPLCGGSPVSTQAKAINENGDVAGDAYCNPVARRPFFWSADGGFEVPAGPPGSSDSPVAAMNNPREIVGTGNFPAVRGYIRQATGQYVTLQTGPNGDWSEGHDVNDASISVGFWGNTVVGPSPLACKWENGQLVTLTELLGAPRGIAYAVNSTGAITGWRGNSFISDARTFILDNEELTVLPPIPGGFTSEGRAINDRGDLAGRGRINTGSVPAQAWRAFAWLDGTMLNLGTLPGFNDSIANDINNHRVIVGISQTAAARAWISQDGVMRDLNDLIPPQPQYTLKTAYSINDDGVIAISGSLGSPAGPTRAFILTPVYPLPADLDGSCSVNGLDLGILLSNWSIPSSAAGCQGDSPCIADLNDDGVVNGLDLGILLSQWTIP